jgi:hypothetical protein
MAGMINPARSKTKAGPKKITSAIGRAFLPLARPAIVNKTPNTIKKTAIAEKTEVNLGTLIERKSDIALFTFLLGTGF